MYAEFKWCKTREGPKSLECNAIMGWDNILLDLSRIRGHADGK